MATTNNDQITIVDENGQEQHFEILFTFESEDFNKSYVLLYPKGTLGDDEVELQAFAYVEDENGEEGILQAIETDEEWDMVEEVLNTFIEEN